MAKRYYSEKYAGYDMRRMQEREDSMMIREDRSAIANLPQQAIMREYPKSPYSGDPTLNDTIRGIDRQIGADVHAKAIKKGSNPKMY